MFLNLDLCSVNDFLNFKGCIALFFALFYGAGKLYRV